MQFILWRSLYCFLPSTQSSTSFQTKRHKPNEQCTVCIVHELGLRRDATDKGNHTCIEDFSQFNKFDEQQQSNRFPNKSGANRINKECRPITTVTSQLHTSSISSVNWEFKHILIYLSFNISNPINLNAIAPLNTANSFPFIAFRPDERHKPNAMQVQSV